MGNSFPKRKKTNEPLPTIIEEEIGNVSTTPVIDGDTNDFLFMNSKEANLLSTSKLREIDENWETLVDKIQEQIENAVISSVHNGKFEATISLTGVSIKTIKAVTNVFKELGFDVTTRGTEVTIQW